MIPPTDLVPAERDPRKLRRTAWTLVAVMVIGGVLVMLAYEKWAVAKSKDNRPSVVHRIKKERDLRIICQDGRTRDLFELRGGVTAIHVMSLSNPETSARSLAVMKRLAERHRDRGDFHLVTLAVDPPPADETVAALSRAALYHGMSHPRWWLGTNEAKTLHKFIKNELRTALFPHVEDGRWVFDTSIVLIDRGGHIRRAVVPQQRGGPPYIANFDFDQAAAWDARGVMTGTGLDNQAQLEKLLGETLDLLLAETTGFE